LDIPNPQRSVRRQGKHSATMDGTSKEFTDFSFNRPPSACASSSTRTIAVRIWTIHRPFSVDRLQKAKI